MSITALLIILVCVANFCLGLVVLLRNPKARSGQTFFLLTLLINAYAITNYLTDNTATIRGNIIFNQLAYLSAFLALVAAATFSRLFASRHLFKSSGVGIVAVASILVMGGLSLTPLIAGNVTGSNGHPQFNQGSLVAVYDLVLIGLLAAIIRDQYHLIRHGNLLQKAQAKIIIGGFSASILVALITNAVIPLLDSSFQTAKFGPPLLSLFLVSSVTYAIFKHKLFDIRVIVARSFAYLLLLGSLTVIFALTLIGLTTLFFSDQQVGLGIKVVYVTLAILMAFLFQPLKRIFDRFSNSIFYRDAYDPQEVIDNLNSALVTTIDIEELLQKSGRIIKDMLKVEFCQFALRIAQDDQPKLVGSGGHLTIEAVTALEQAARVTSKRIIVADELEGQALRLKELLQNQQVSALVRLRSINIGRSHHNVYILVGQKSSGSIYSEQDVAILDILADELVIAIQNALRFEEIKRFNLTLQEKVDEATKQLRQANSRLKQLDQTKDEFISMASHQLRTPLTTIKGYLSMVLEGDVGPVTKNERDMIQHAFDGAERMVFLIGDLLNVSRLQSGKFVIDNKPMDLNKMINDEVTQLQETAKNHHLTLTYKKPEKFPMLNLDETKIRQVIMNFIDNAIYYTPAEGSITVALEAADKEIRFTVTDTGLGVPKEAQHHLFSKFYRAGNARKMRPDGTGLGLFMAKKVITAQGGAIIFNSVEGKGSTFGFSFPRSQVELKSSPSEKPKEAALAA